MIKEISEAMVQEFTADAGLNSFRTDYRDDGSPGVTEWRPAIKDGVRVKMWIDLKIEFRP